jgi:sugar O-acyltransferase (sialic acid O-acetyltransferase NeuD family)
MIESDNRIVIFGAGGHAKTLIGVLLAEGRWQLAGLLVESIYANPGSVLGYEVLGDETRLDALRQSGIEQAIVAIGDNQGRSRMAGLLRHAGYSLVSVIHPSAAIMAEACVAEGACIHAFCVIGPECRIGRNAIIQPFASIGHEGLVGECVQFSPGVHIGGKVRIGDNCFFGPGAVVYPKVTIGQNVSVGANSVINKDVPDNAVIVGNPARLLKTGQ